MIPSPLHPPYPATVIPANAGTHGFARLLDRTIAGRTPSMGPGVRRDDGQWAVRHPDMPHHIPEPSQ